MPATEGYCTWSALAGPSLEKSWHQWCAEEIKRLDAFLVIFDGREEMSIQFCEPSAANLCDDVVGELVGVIARVRLVAVDEK